MSYLAFDRKSCDEIVTNRFFQNLGFLPARELISLVKGGGVGVSGLVVDLSQRGVIVSAGASASEDVFVIDLDTTSFVTDCGDSELLAAIQKTLRFCIKCWDGLALSSGEMYVKGSSKALVFPFPYVANRSGYRITIEREPNAKRLSKRDEGKYLLAYKSGTSEGDGANEEPSLTVFRKAYDDFQVFKSNAIERQSNPSCSAEVSSLGVTKLTEDISSNIPVDLGFERWMYLLTDDQKKFVASDCLRPHRLEGPAGTGKTLCLVLKSISSLKKYKESEKPHKAIFIVPSEELADSIKSKIEGNGGGEFLEIEFSNDYVDKKQCVFVVTLQKLCANLLNYEINESEFLDRDSVESKNTQLLYLDQIVSEIKKSDLSSVSSFLSKEFYEFLSSEDAWTLAQLFRHEVGVVIKGRANGSLESYKGIPSLDYGLPVRTDRDKEFVYSKYNEYQQILEKSGQYDIDDIVISAIGQLDTPIWRRRRQQLGFDSIYIDEVHLFNLNETSVLHYLTKSSSVVPISYSIDRSQAVGDIGWNDSDFYRAIGANREDSQLYEGSVSAIFRSSNDIVELAFCVTSSGASLFTNFENPLDQATGTFTADEERKCEKPCIVNISDDAELPAVVYRRVDFLAKSMNCGKDGILVVVFDELLLNKIKGDWKVGNKGFRSLEKRGDYSVLTEAGKAGCPVIGLPELVGGLEFSGVILVGCEKGRLPPIGCSSDFGRAYLNYRSHNNLYVSITRAKYRLEVIVNSSRGVSDILNRAVRERLLEECCRE